jgi:hypothetical protein
MSGILLFGKLRRWGAVLATSLASAALIIICGPIRYSLNPNDGFLIAVVAQVPLVTAVVIQAASASPVPVVERRAARPLRRFRAANYLVLTAATGVILALAASLLGSTAATNEFGAFAVARNLCALIGASYISASLLGQSLGWCLPAAWTILPYVLLTQESGKHEVLTLVTQPDSSYAAFIAAALSWLTGLFLVSATRRDVLEFVPEVMRLVQEHGTRTSKAKNH